MEQFKDKKILVVNVASECGLTPQYAELEMLYQKYSDKLVILGFPYRVEKEPVQQRRNTQIGDVKDEDSPHRIVPTIQQPFAQPLYNSALGRRWCQLWVLADGIGLCGCLCIHRQRSTIAMRLLYTFMNIEMINERVR